LFGRHFPGSGAFAGPQADDRATDSDRLAGPQLKIPGQTIALVEKAERCNALRHRRADLFGHRSDQVAVGCGKLAFFRRLASGMFIDLIAVEPAAAGQQKRRCEHR